MSPVAAQTIALDALTWVLERENEREAFLTASGSSPGELREGSQDPLLLAAILDHVLSRESSAREFCESRDLTGRDLQLARHVLGGP